ncbi:hypothetical protein JCM11641_001199 [Rhodosporidiobolus odoratus]
MSGHEGQLAKRYPPEPVTAIPTTTPAWKTSQTPTASTTSLSPSSALVNSAGVASSFTTSAPSGQFAAPSSRALVAATTSPATTCAPSYVAPTMITGTGTFAKPSSFAKKTARSQQITVDGQRFNIVGPNIYWLCSDENVAPLGAPPDKGRIREALAIAVAMGANTIRTLTCGISVGPGTPYNYEQTYRKFNQDAFEIRDYVLYAAREYGLRVIMTMVDQHAYYHGGVNDFINFRHASTANNGYQFYQNRAVINAYTEYITSFINHVNTYTGIRYGDDPTILAWETGNELGGYINAYAWPPAAWTTQVIRVIRMYDTNHLIIDGSNGFWNYTNNASPAGLTNRAVSIMSDHGYPRNTGILNHEVGLAAQNLKGFLIGEYDWTSTQSTVTLDAYISALEAQSNYIGDMIWNVMGHDAQCCFFISHNDGYSLYYPNGNSAPDQANILKVAQHWHRVRGLAVPTQLKGVVCPQPVF